MMKILLQTLLLILPLGLAAQSYTDYIGAGHNVGMTVSSSSSQGAQTPDVTFSGKGMDSPYFSAARFLSQATFGPTVESVEALLEADNYYEGWIDDQFLIPESYITPEMEFIWDSIKLWYASENQDTTNIFGPYKIHMDYAWYQTIMTEEDQLRHKVAYALSQILVVSDNSQLIDWAEAMTDYYDMLLEHSFGNYRDLLEEVTYSIQMGYYLSHLNNAKENPEANTSPDENYAREIMQLFSIGLYELNLDGTRILDQAGNPIPTYDQNDIQEFAKVFTGLGIGEIYEDLEWPPAPFFGLDLWAAKKDEPMVMYQDFHETEEKYLLNGMVLPANQTGEQDITDAIDNLFNHANVGPFISNLLIKRIVKSNPSPAYIARVATIFNDNGSGVRGDLKAVVKAILLDEEARDGSYMQQVDASRVKEPLMRFTGQIRGLPLNLDNGNYWHLGYSFKRNLGQNILSSPTVFNFYPPDFQPVGDIKDAELTSPELKLHNSTTALNHINEAFVKSMWEGWLFDTWEGYFYDPTPGVPGDGEWISMNQGTTLDLDYFLDYADHPELLVNELDKLLTCGQLTDNTRNGLIPVLRDMYWEWNDNWKLERVKLAIYIILISPDYAVIK